MAAKRTLALTIIGSAKGAVDALRMTDATATKLGKTVAKTSAALGVAFAAVGAAAAYMGKQVFDGAMMAVRGAAEDQKSVALLEKQIRAATFATDEQIRKNEEFIASMQYAAAVADTELRAALGNLVRGTGNLTDAQTLLKLSLDISAATGKELGAVTMAMGRAATGNVGALTRLGIPIDENAKKSKNFNAVVQQLTKSFSGASDTAVATFDGRMRQLRIGIDEAVESIGYALLPYAERLVTFINTHIVPAVQLFAANIGKEGIGGAAAIAIASMGDMGKRTLDSFEQMSIGVLEFGKKVVKVGKYVALAIAAIHAAYGNVVMAAIAGAASVGLDKLESSLGDMLAKVPGAFDKMRDAVDAASKKIAAQKEEQEELRRRGLLPNNEETRKGTGLQEQYGGAVGGAAKEIDKGKMALESYTRQLNTSRQAVKDAARASADLKRADETVADSLKNLMAVRRKFEQVTRGYGAGSQEAADKGRDLARAQRDLERSGYDVEQATFAVADAESKLAELRADPAATAQDIREAEIALAEARLAVADANDKQHESTLSLRDAQQQLDTVVNGAKEGTQEYADALAELEAAQRSYQDAIEAQTEAREREAEAIKKVREEEEALAKLRAALPKGTQIDDAGNVVEQPKTGRGAAFPNFMSAVRALHPNAPALKSSTPVKAARMQFPNLYKEFQERGLALADGGIVRRPTTALIGEAGPEAVIPLRDVAALGTTNVYVTVNAGMGVDPAVVGDEIVNVLQRYNRRNGALPLKVA